MGVKPETLPWKYFTLDSLFGQLVNKNHTNRDTYDYVSNGNHMVAVFY